MISKLKSWKKGLLRLSFATLFVLINTTESNAQYKEVYFDARIDMVNHRVKVNISANDTDGQKGLEDRFISDHMDEGSGSYPRRSRSDKIYKTAMEPDDYAEGSVYINTKMEDYVPLFNPNNRPKDYTIGVAKKNTIPAAKFVWEGEDVEYTGLKLDSRRVQILDSAIRGGSSRTEKQGKSMIDGLNSILAAIGKVRDYDEESFLQTLKGVTWLITYGGKSNPNGGTYPSSITFDASIAKVLDSESGEETKEEGKEENTTDPEKEEGKEENTTDPEKEDFVGNGKPITVTVSGNDDYKRKITVTQEGVDGALYSQNQLYRLTTGFEVVGGIGANGEATIRITDTELKEKYGDKRLVAAEGSTLDTLSADDVKWIYLYDLIMDAFIKYDYGVTANGDSLESSSTTMSPATKEVQGVLGDMVDTFESEIGLEDVENLVYNKDTRVLENKEYGYHMGLFPQAWMPIILSALSIVSVICILFLAFAVIRILYLMNLDAMNVTTRLNLKADIANVIYAVFGMMLFGVVFYLMSTININIVNLIYSVFGDGDVAFFETFTSAEGGFATIILKLVMIGIKIYMNVIYLIRALNISLLIVLAPIFILGTAFLGPERIKVFLRELSSNIFLQSFHALIILFIVKAKSAMMGTEGIGLFNSLVLASSIVPVTSMFRELAMGEGKSLMVGARMGDQAKQTMTSLGRQGLTMAATAGGAAYGISKGLARMGGHLAGRGVSNKFDDFSKNMKNEGSSGKVTTVPSQGAGGATGDEAGQGATGSAPGQGTAGDTTGQGATGSAPGKLDPGFEGDTGGATKGDAKGDAKKGKGSFNPFGMLYKVFGRKNYEGEEAQELQNYVDPNIEKKFRLRDRVGQSYRDAVEMLDATGRYIKSGGRTRELDNLNNVRNMHKERRKYMDANSESEEERKERKGWNPF